MEQRIDALDEYVRDNDIGSAEAQLVNEINALDKIEVVGVVH